MHRTVLDADPRPRGSRVKLVKVESTLDGSKVTVFFAAEERLDLRDLARDLADALRTRVEMKQIGARDETKVTGGVGPCGRELCCSSWLQRVPAGVGQDGEGAGAVAQPVEARRHVRAAQVLPALRVRDLRRAPARAADGRHAGRVASRATAWWSRQNVLRQTVVVRRADDGVEVEATLDDLVSRRPSA